MIIAGAGGLSVEIVQILDELKYNEPIVCFSDQNPDNKTELFPGIPILSNEKDLINWMSQHTSQFVVGVGNPIMRELFKNKLEALGGELTSVISPNVTVGNRDVTIGSGAVIFPGVRISNRVNIGENTLIYYNSIITHDVIIGDHVEISPAAVLLGASQIKSHVHVGSNATILPRITINEGARIGAGAVVTKNVEQNAVMVGVPAVKKVH
jgi:sugar O-acyltransferase (sialic acid O-acetyltransferase NeuD family)